MRGPTLLVLVTIAACGAAAGSLASDTHVFSASAVDGPPTASSTSIDTPPAIPLACSEDAAALHDFTGSLPTTPVFTQPIVATIAPAGERWCTGGSGAATITLTNAGRGVEHVRNPRLVLHGESARWTLVEWSSFDLDPGGSRTFDASFTVPRMNPGTYRLIVYGFDGSANIGVEGKVRAAEFPVQTSVSRTHGVA